MGNKLIEMLHAAWPAEKSGPGRQKYRKHFKDKRIEMLHGQQNWADTSSDRKGGHILRKNSETLRKGKLLGE